MAPKSSEMPDDDEVLESETMSTLSEHSQPRTDGRKLQIVWKNVILFTALHLGALYGAWLFFTAAMWQTKIFTYVMYILGGFGITAGAHRLWTHRSYKATPPLGILLMILNSIAFQNSVIEWVRDHRMHHKYSETDADPHNATRGLFFSHIGWLFCRKHPEIKAKGHTIDLSDVYADPILVFQKKYYFLLITVFCFGLTTLIPMIVWGESFHNAWFVSTLFRYTYTLNSTWTVNSLAHAFGNKPYNVNIKPSQSTTVNILVMGEGYHNYHHTFPWDYKTGESGGKLNLTKKFINLMAYIGWAYDLKSAPEELIKKRVQRTGDGSHPIWGWGDKDQLLDEIETVNAHSKNKIM